MALCCVVQSVGDSSAIRAYRAARVPTAMQSVRSESAFVTTTSSRRTPDVVSIICAIIYLGNGARLRHRFT